MMTARPAPTRSPKTDGGTFCAGGTCVFAFSGQGCLQGDVSGGLILAF